MKDSSENKNKEIPKPWEHTVSIGVNRVASPIDGTETIEGTIAKCSCGQYQLAFDDTMSLTIVADHINPHYDTHPLPPLAIAETGDEMVVLVMNVPGPEEGVPVHMTITVSKDVYKDGEKLGKHLGMIGSPVHFQSESQRKQFRQQVQGNGLHVMEIPFPDGIANVVDFLERIHGQTETEETGHEEAEEEES